MDWSVVVVGLAGIGGTLLAPWVAGRVQRRASVHAERIAVYSELMDVAGRLADNAQSWAALPLSDRPEPSDEQVRTLYARVRVVGSDAVLRAAKEVSGLSFDFVRELVPAQMRHASDREDGSVDSGEGIKMRLALGRIADDLQAAVTRLESAIRSEMKA
jgi:hypothetical protein